MLNEWVVVGISGATCSGKTTLAKNLHEMFPQSVVICQDDYFFPIDSPHHVRIESLGHFNWEIMSALDMKNMRADISNVLSQNPSSVVLPTKAKRSELNTKEDGIHESFPYVLILEGFLLLNDDDILDLCDLSYYLTLTRDQCWSRRQVRVYDPPDIPGYFDKVVWPEYEKNRDQVLLKSKVKVIDGMGEQQSIAADVLRAIKRTIQVKIKRN